MGARTGTLIVNTNDTKYPVISIALTGNGVDFSIAVAPASGSVIAGCGVTLNLVLTPLGGYSAPITLTCNTTAGGSVCTPAQTSLTLSTATNDAVTVTTTSQYTIIGYSGLVSRPWLLLLSMISSGLLLVRRGRHLLPRLAGTVVLLGLLGAVNLGCSGKTPAANTNPTLAGTYPYTFSATDGTLTHTAVYTLTATIR